MLILTRRINETMMIGDDVNITVLDVKGNQVRLGINAPLSIPVHREEIYRRIKAKEQQGGLNDCEFDSVKRSLSERGGNHITH